MKYYKVEISAENREQADTILNGLLAKKLVTGGQIIQAPTRFLWKGEIVDMDYVTIHSFTIEQHKEVIMAEVKELSVEEVPMVAFVGFEGSQELLGWIKRIIN